MGPRLIRVLHQSLHLSPCGRLGYEKLGFCTKLACTFCRVLASAIWLVMLSHLFHGTFPHFRSCFKIRGKAKSVLGEKGPRARLACMRPSQVCVSTQDVWGTTAHGKDCMAGFLPLSDLRSRRLSPAETRPQPRTILFLGL